jgi:phage terminase large subunit-like protein
MEVHSRSSPSLQPRRSFRLTADQEQAQSLLAGPQRHTCLVGGARSGKTTLLVRAIAIRALRAPSSRHAILRFRANAARTSVALDTLPKVFKSCFPGVKLREKRQDGYFLLPNDSELWIGGLDDKERVDKILGREFATIYLCECSEIPYASVLVVLTRLAQVVPYLKQRAYYDLNPVGRGHWTNRLFGEKRDPLSREPLTNGDDYQRMFLNPEGNRDNLTDEYLQSLTHLPERQRKRFYEGVYIDEVENSLWTYDRLAAIRCDPLDLPQLARVVVAVDPSGARGEEDKRSDEIGIVVVGLGVDGRAYVLEDLSCRMGPAGWARRAVEAYHRHQADAILGEFNFGGAMVEETIRTQDPLVRFVEVRASRGKHVRAEPIAALYEDKIDRVRHVGRLPDLEDQLCMFTTAGYSGERSPDRADALIWALSHLMLEAQAPRLLFG